MNNPFSNLKTLWFLPAKLHFFVGIILIGIVGLLSFLAVFFWGSPAQGILVKIVFNLSIFVPSVRLAFFVSFLLQMFFIKAFKKDDFILGDEWTHFRRGVFIGLSVILLSYLNRANLFHWLEALFLIVLFFGWEFIYFKSKRLSAISS